MHKDYDYLIIVAYFFKITWNLKNKIICYQSPRVNRIDNILLSGSYERSLWS
jgi:hypothetical protein